MKTEELYRTNYRSERELLKSITNFITFYNTERPHSILRYMTPNKFEDLYYKYHPNEIEQDGSNLLAF